MFMLFLCCVCVGTNDQFVEAVSLLRERAEKDEPNSLYSLVNDLSKVAFHTWVHGLLPMISCTGVMQEAAQ